MRPKWTKAAGGGAQVGLAWRHGPARDPQGPSRGVASGRPPLRDVHGLAPEMPRGDLKCIRTISCAGFTAPCWPTRAGCAVLKVRTNHHLNNKNLTSRRRSRDSRPGRARSLGVGLRGRGRSAELPASDYIFIRVAVQLAARSSPDLHSLLSVWLHPHNPCGAKRRFPHSVPPCTDTATLAELSGGTRPALPSRRRRCKEH